MKLTLRACRVNCNYSLDEVAKIINVTPKTLSNWERGITDISAIELRKLSRIYNIASDSIMLSEELK